MNKFVSSKHLESVSDLTLVAPIKKGFIDAFESVTYETRLHLLLKALFKIRSTAREHSKIKPFVDTAERIQSLLDFRLTILDEAEPHRLMLSATFDRPFEPYMRLIWDPLGPLLDVIFCNCEGYVTATGHCFEDYLAWVRKAQKDAEFFYSMSGHSVTDVQYLLQIERLQRERDAPTGTAVTAPDPEAEAAEVRRRHRPESNFLGLEALIGLYRLTDFYPPDSQDGDGELLRKAAQQLLRGWAVDMNPAWGSKLIPEQLSWFSLGNEKAFTDKSDDEKRADEIKEERERRLSERLTFRPQDIQGGIIEDYGGTKQLRTAAAAEDSRPPIRHGALLLMRICDAQMARAFIGSLEVADGTHSRSFLDEDIFLNLGLTFRGLVNVGVPECDLARFPQEFREGMEERAGLLGDLRSHHPRRWLPPRRNWPEKGETRIDLSEVDLVLQLRTTRPVLDRVVDDIHDEGHPLIGAVRALAKAGKASGVELVAVETMRRAFPDSECNGRDHFGFVDGISQPIPVDRTPRRLLDEVSRGELLWGYVNDRSDPPPPPSELLDNGTFLVVRKLRQNPRALHELVARESARRRYDRDGTCFKVPAAKLYGKLVGRQQDGTIMLDNVVGNRFDYDKDPRGEQCPFQAHIRRANPRSKREGETKRPNPRILRRGLSYGPPIAAGDEEAERGVMFMAYGASIAEQYEVIQRWINAGNSTGTGSWLRDPFMGVPEGDPEFKFRFRYFPAPSDRCRGETEEAQPTTVRIGLAKPFVDLQWGTYLFVPSMAAIKAIARLSPVEGEEQGASLQQSEARRGEAIIERLSALAATGGEGRAEAARGWKTCLEDFMSKDPGERADGPAVWAAIRAFHGGAMRVPYGSTGPGESPREVVLVASKDFVMRVFRNRDGHYSMCGQMGRMKQSFGPIFLGLDGGEEYELKAQINEPIYQISEIEAFSLAYKVAAGRIKGTLDLFATMGLPDDKPTGVGRWGELDLRRDFVTPVLETICNLWFGIPDQAPGLDTCTPNHVDPGGWGWEAVRKPRCPGDFLATSRYCFYPDPVPRVQAYGKAQGRALRKAARAHFKEVTAPEAKIAKIMAGIEVYMKDKDEFARTLIGVMTGFLPPADATLRWTLYEWLEEKLFWRLQQDLVSAPGLAPNDPAAGTPFADEFRRAQAALMEPLKRAMQKRPSPDMLWRTSVRSHRLGPVEVCDGDRVFIGIVSAMAEDRDAGVVDIYPVFGGKRTPSPPAGGERDCPLHACPASKFALGTMLGILAALMDKLRIEALPSPLLVRISDRLPGSA